MDSLAEDSELRGKARWLEFRLQSIGEEGTKLQTSTEGPLQTTHMLMFAYVKGDNIGGKESSKRIRTVSTGLD